ncbi:MULTISPECIES: hypothetical protein [unclassified Nocardia]|uniref:hypothetical protein n=1 Tax=unclassified Nocardia TaxID=2637762 RepID=UPI001CE3DA16|nr:MULTISPECIES: hypothetical protein [unclassified Nocardia]
MGDFNQKDLDTAVSDFKTRQQEWRKQPDELNDHFDRLKYLSPALYWSMTDDRDEAQEKLKKLLTKIEEAAEGISAPFVFVRYAADWQTVAGKVRNANNEQGRPELNLDGHWAGKAKLRFSASRTSQQTAMATSADLCEKVHEQLINLAKAGADFYKSLADRFTQFLAGLASAYVKISTLVEAPFGISDAIDLIGKAIQFVEQTIADTALLLQKQQISANELLNLTNHQNGFPQQNGKDHWPNSVAQGFANSSDWELAK